MVDHIVDPTDYKVIISRWWKVNEQFSYFTDKIELRLHNLVKK